VNVPFLSVKDAYVELKEEIDAAVARVLESGHYILSPEVESFEREFAEFVGARHCIGVGNGLDAITLSLLAHGIGKGDEVLVPSNTFIATWLGATHAAATPIPVEPDFATHLVDAARLEWAITPRTRAIIPVHLYGLPVDMPAIRELCTRRGLVLIDDAAQAHGAAVGATRIGGFGNTSTWSFYPGKNLGALGDGGAVTTDDDAVAARLRQLRNYGSSVKYIHDVVGFNTRLDPIQAAVLRVKLKHLETWNTRRRRVAESYVRTLSGVGDLQLPRVPEGRLHAYHLYVLRTARRDALQQHLEGCGIGTIVHYPRPPHLQSAYREAGLDAGRLGATARAADEVLSLPIGPHVSDQQLEAVCGATRVFFGEKS
jgi:dTDP-4-amino-4,6-dideoxygalactose transaminase